MKLKEPVLDWRYYNSRGECPDCGKTLGEQFVICLKCGAAHHGALAGPYSGPRCRCVCRECQDCGTWGPEVTVYHQVDRFGGLCPTCRKIRELDLPIDDWVALRDKRRREVKTEDAARDFCRAAGLPEARP